MSCIRFFLFKINKQIKFKNTTSVLSAIGPYI